MNAPDFSIILPVHDQADHIESLVGEYVRGLAAQLFSWEMLLVVNGCRDHSGRLCEQLARQDERIRVLQSEAGGWGLAVRLGLAAASGRWLCYTNSARTAAQDLVQLLLFAETNAGAVVKANRKIREGWRRRLGSLLYNLECRALFDLPYWDINGSPKVFPRSCSRLLELSLDNDLVDLEFHVICRQENYLVLEVPIFSARRFGGRSTTTWVSALRMYLGAWRLYRKGFGRLPATR
jgi:glycosyltransferase involved in cell wall biosynthesis